MTDKAPERIWMHAEAVNQEDERFWVANRIGVGDFKTGYIRADIHQALEAERDHYADLYSKECDNYSVMHVRIVETEDERDHYASLLQDLLSRIFGWEADNLSDENCRDWMGHVEPVIARARAALEDKQ